MNKGVPHLRSQIYEIVGLVLGHTDIQLYPHLTCLSPAYIPNCL